MSRKAELYRVGLIGCGWMAPFHVAGLESLRDRARIVWVADPVRERAEAIALQVGARSLTDYREDLGEIDCAFVLVPHHLHHPVTLDCFQAGCHVLLEKPITETLAQADELVALATRLNVDYTEIRALEPLAVKTTIAASGR